MRRFVYPVQLSSQYSTQLLRARKGEFGQYHCKFVKFGKPP